MIEQDVGVRLPHGDIQHPRSSRKKNAVTAHQPTEIFVNAWDLYKRVVDADLMFHREIGEELRQVLREKFGGRPFSILDLGCGDAANLAPRLEGLTVTR
jgi:class 3 adenylate cyclase